MKKAFLFGLGIVSGALMAEYYHKTKNEIEECAGISTVKVDKHGNVTELILRDNKCSRSYLRKKLGKEINIAKEIQKQNADCEDGVTMILN